MDNIAGDGDCGLTLKGGATGRQLNHDSAYTNTDCTTTAVLEALRNGTVSGDDVLGSVITISRIAEDAMGGTSGALYSSVS
jgi:dihydroxyacetone kinase